VVAMTPARMALCFVAFVATLAIGRLTGTALSVGCASVLDVDKTYVLGDEGIRCASGAADCAPGMQECCLGAGNSLACVGKSAGDPCPGGTDIACDDKADCPGTLCCIQLDSSNALLGTACLATCPAGQRNGSSLELCASGASSCTSGTCQPLSGVTPSALFSQGWFSACQP
jgi:hypothetical protein